MGGRRSGIWDVWTLCRAAESRILGIWKKLNLESAPGDKKRPEPASGDKQRPGGDWSYLGWWLCLDTCSSFHSTNHRLSHLAFTMAKNKMPSFCLFMTQKSTLTHLTPSLILLRLVLYVYGQSSHEINTPSNAYDKVAVNLKQFMVLDEISREVIYPYFFASGQLILMHRTHFIQNIWRKWPKSSIFKICTAVATKTTSPL